ncbi:MAG TPA: lipopolysaccharide assembly protein LapB [Methylophaga aminisulfidivorans]|uniref:Lipopolysaccharide assembly protein B n=2 Tax=root TaxID=1 RepID=A0A7C1VNS3_9GAMM|nr:lipopolysaccharide assembly protein LapB [Methylophaga aminisulfidivorans]
MMGWLFLLLPVAALSGWLMARKHYKQRYRPKNSSFNPEYFKGLNYLLNEQPDKAIDIFIGLLEVNSETVETHLALANLFRRRGETDRAIKIHQNLIARPSLSSEQRKQALIELGIDYTSAGVLDRAEVLFLEVLKTPHPPVEAIKQLLRIYQQEKNWLQAIKMAERIPEHRNEINFLIAQFYCELAEPLIEKDFSQGIKYLKSALQHDQSCVRASLLEAQYHMNNDDHRKAIKLLQKIEQQNVDFIPESLSMLEHCYEQTGNVKEFQQWLESIIHKHPQLTSVRLMLTQIIQKRQGSQQAQRFLYKQLHHHPSVEGLHQLIILGEDNHKVLIPLIKEVTTTLIHKGDRYSCKSCSFSGRTMHWQCPGCSKWGTIHPIEIHLSSLEKLLEPSR